MALVLDWLQAEQPGELVRQAVDSLRSGGLVALPTEAGYVAAASATMPEFAQKLADLLPRSNGSLIFGVPDDVRVRLAEPALDLVGTRLIRRCWPGPLVVALPEKQAALLASDIPVATKGLTADLEFWSPGHSVTQAVLLAAEFPILIRELPAETVHPGNAVWEKMALCLQAGPPRSGPTTRVSVAEGSWNVMREGLVSTEDLNRAAACWIGFICTGNTCRSPMAEALMKARLADRLGCTVANLPERGYNIFSAGVAAYSADGAALEAVRVMQGLGADLSAHRSQPLTEVLLAQADHLVAMTRGHLMTVLGRYPAPSASMSLLCGNEGDLDDPIGGGPEVYEACARTILRHVERLIKELNFR